MSFYIIIINRFLFLSLSKNKLSNTKKQFKKKSKWCTYAYKQEDTPTLQLVHKRWWCVFFKSEKISKKKKKKLFISSFEVDALNKAQVSYRMMMMMNMRSAFLGWCCVYSTSKRIIKFIKEKSIEFSRYIFFPRDFPPIITSNE
jgi:hypothetical protein